MTFQEAARSTPVRITIAILLLVDAAVQYTYLDFALSFPQGFTLSWTMMENFFFIALPVAAAALVWFKKDRWLVVYSVIKILSGLDFVAELSKGEGLWPPLFSTTMFLVTWEFVAAALPAVFFVEAWKSNRRAS